MRAWTAHLAPDREPVLLPEGFSWGALLFGPVWLLLQRAWIPAILYVAAVVALSALPLPRGAADVLGAAIAVLTGVLGRDWVRWSLERRGYAEGAVLAARDGDAAYARLLAARPDLTSGLVDRALDRPADRFRADLWDRLRGRAA